MKVGEIAYFFRQMATLIDAGIPLVQSMDILVEREGGLRMKGRFNPMKPGTSSRGRSSPRSGIRGFAMMEAIMAAAMLGIVVVGTMISYRHPPFLRGTFIDCNNCYGVYPLFY